MRRTRQITPPFVQKFIIIDTHGGEEDILGLVCAIKLAKRYNKTIIGITCVNGRRSLSQVVHDVLIAQQMAGSHIPVYKGSKQSILLNAKYPVCYNFTSVDERLNQMQIKQEWKKLVKDEYAPIFIADQIVKYRDELCIITFGPLTNVAIAFHRSKPINSLSSLYINGGAFSGVGNVMDRCGAQANFHYDPEAAHIVLSNYKNIFINPIEMTLSISWKAFINHLQQKQDHLLLEILATKQTLCCGPLLTILPVFLKHSVKKMYDVYSEVMTEGKQIMGLMAPNWMRLQVKQGEQVPNTKINAEYDLQISQAMLLQAYL